MPSTPRTAHASSLAVWHCAHTGSLWTYPWEGEGVKSKAHKGDVKGLVQVETGNRGRLQAIYILNFGACLPMFIRMFTGPAESERELEVERREAGASPEAVPAAWR